MNLVKTAIRGAAMLYNRMRCAGVLRDLVALLIATAVLVVGIVMVGLVIACWQGDATWPTG